MREKRKKCFCCAYAHKIALYVSNFFMFYAFMFYARIKWPPGPNFLCAHKTDTHINIKRKSAYVEPVCFGCQCFFASLRYSKSPLLSLLTSVSAQRFFSSSLLNMDPPSLSGVFDFGASFSDFGSDFGQAFEFGSAFDAGFGNFHGSVSVQFDDASVPLGGWFDDDVRPLRDRRERRPNRHYRIESVHESAWYQYFTRPGMTRELTHELSASDRYSQFRHFFRMPLWKVEELTDLLIERAYIPYPRSKSRQVEFRERTELLIMSSLYLLGTGSGFRSCQPLCSISTSEVRKFFFLFLDAICDMRSEQISMPSNITAYQRVEGMYSANGLPGCCGSIDVVHVRWSNCPAGDYNRAKGKESYPSLGFECVTDFNRRIMSIYGPHFGSRNDMDIVKTDKSVAAMSKKSLFRDARWKYYDQDGEVRTNRGAYLICDNGYLRWPTTICPFTRVDVGSAQGYFTTHLEGIRKDVECTFGILKKRWRILNNGFFYRQVKVCEKIFVTCCWLHNFLLDLMDCTNINLSRGAPIGNDGLWLSGPSDSEPPADEGKNDRILSEQFSHRRAQLVHHLHMF